MQWLQPSLMPIVSSLGIGLLVGLERERKKDRKTDSSAIAGLRTFAITSLLGCTAMTLGDALLLSAVAVGLAAFMTAAYFRTRKSEPGLTTETALMMVLVLGGYSVRSPGIAVGLGVVLTLLLAYRERLHHFARAQMTEQEVRDGLTLAAAALVILPLVPDQPIDPYGAINLRTVWKLTVLMMAISAAGHIAIRVVGPRLGLAIAGFVSGFASSTATIASMGTRSRENPALLWPTAAGAMMSTVATMVYMGIVLYAINPETALKLLPALGAAGLVAAVYSLGCFMRMPHGGGSGDSELGHAFSLRNAILLTLTITAILLLATVLFAWLGNSGVMISAAIGGLADTQAAGGSIAVLVQSRQITAAAAVLPVLCALSTNTVSKCVAAMLTGGVVFSVRVIPGLLLVLGTLWIIVLQP